MAQDSSNPASDEILDLPTLQQLLDLDDGELGLIKEMLQLFLEDTPQRIDALDVAIQSGNSEELGDVAHAVKGAAATMGAPQVRALALALETAGRMGKTEVDPSVLVAKLREEFQKAVTGLEEFIASKS